MFPVEKVVRVIDHLETPGRHEDGRFAQDPRRRGVRHRPRDCGGRLPHGPFGLALPLEPLTIAEKTLIEVGDVVHEASGASKIAFKAMEVLGVNGVFIFTGVLGRKGPVEINANLSMRGVLRMCWSVPERVSSPS